MYSKSAGSLCALRRVAPVAEVTGLGLVPSHGMAWPERFNRSNCRADDKA